MDALTRRRVEVTYPSVRKWTSRVSIFDKKYVIVPVNEKSVFPNF